MKNVKILPRNEVRWENFPDKFYPSKGISAAAFIAALLVGYFIVIPEAQDIIANNHIPDWNELFILIILALFPLSAIVFIPLSICLKRFSLPRYALGNEGMLVIQRKGYSFIPWGEVRNVEKYIITFSFTSIRFIRILWKDEQYNKLSTQLMTSHSMIAMQSKKELQTTLERAQFYLQKRAH